MKKTLSRLLNNSKEKDVNLPTKTLCRDPLSDPRQLSFDKPGHLIGLYKRCRSDFRHAFRDTRADMLNESMLDNMINNVGDEDVNEARLQYTEHLTVVERIENAQKVAVSEYKKKVEKIDEETAGIKQAYPDIDQTDTRYTKKIQRGITPFYKKTFCLILVVLFSITLDYTTISSSVDSLLTQNRFLSILLSVCIAALLDVDPAIAGVYLKDKAAENRKPVLIMLGIIFFTLFGVISVLRFTTMDSLYQDTSQLFLGGEQSIKTGHTSSEIVMTVLLAIEPALSSILSLVFGFISATGEEKKKNMSEIRYAELIEEREDLNARIQELEDVIEKKQNLINEEASYKAQLELIEIYKNKLKEEARIQLATLCKKAEANSHILQREEAVLFSI